jgi:hypothetical protein
VVASARHFDRTPRSTPTQAATRTSPPPHLTRTMAHAVMSAVTVNASARPAAKVTGRSTMFAKRCETRKLAAQAATRSVQARAITEVTAESTDANSALYEEFKKLLVDYEFAYKVGDRVSGKVFHCDAKGAWVDIGAKAAALCPSAEASLADVRNVRPTPRSDAIPTAPTSSPSRAAPRGLPPVARASAASRATAFERAHFLTRAPTRVRPNAREWINDKRERRRDVSPPASRPTVTLTRPIPPPPGTSPRDAGGCGVRHRRGVRVRDHPRRRRRRVPHPLRAQDSGSFPADFFTRAASEKATQITLDPQTTVPNSSPSPETPPPSPTSPRALFVASTLKNPSPEHSPPSVHSSPLLSRRTNNSSRRLGIAAASSRLRMRR